MINPAVAGADRQDVGLGDHRHRVEVEAVEGFAGQELCFGEMSCHVSTVAFDDLMLGQGGEEARVGPAFLPPGRRSPTSPA